MERYLNFSQQVVLAELILVLHLKNKRSLLNLLKRHLKQKQCLMNNVKNLLLHYRKIVILHENRIFVILDYFSFQLLVLAWAKIHLDISVRFPSSHVTSFQILEKNMSITFFENKKICVMEPTLHSLIVNFR